MERGNKDNVKKSNFLNKFADLMGFPSFSEHMRQLEENEYKPKHDLKLQYLYDGADIVADPNNLDEFLKNLRDYNMESPAPTLASGQNSYFNAQIDQTGFEKRLRLQKQDAEDAKFIANCLNKDVDYDKNDLPILYTTLPGTIEFNYATQTFPAGIYEDVFQENADHSLSIQPFVDEPENLYWKRVLREKLSTQNLPSDQLTEAYSRGERLIDKFCRGKNRIYFLPIDDLRQNHSSFGDVTGLRNGHTDEKSMVELLGTMPTLDEELEQFHVGNIYEAYENPNFSSEHGVAIYGPIKSKGIKYIEVDRSYDIVQKRAKLMGLQSGELIGSNK